MCIVCSSSTSSCVAGYAHITRRGKNDTLLKYSVGRPGVVDTQRICKIVLRVIEAERRVSDALCGRLKPDRGCVGRCPVADDTRGLDRIDRPVRFNAEDADIEFAGQCSISRRNCVH